MHPRSRSSRRAARLAPLLVVATAAACASGSPDAAAPSPSTSAPTTEAPTPTAPRSTSTTLEPPPATAAPAEGSPEQEVLAAYQAFWDTWLAANDPPDPDHPGLRRYYTGPALEKAITEIEKNKKAGLSIRLPTPSQTGVRAPVVTVAGDAAVIEACLVDDAITVLTSSGAVIDSEVETSQLRVDLVRGPAGWSVARNQFLSTRTGSSCP